MPRSKHRRKPGGKSVKRPGRNRGDEAPVLPSDARWDRFRDTYLRPFYQQDHPGEECVREMLDLVIDRTTTYDMLSFYPVSKVTLVRGFVEPLEVEDGTFATRTPEEAEVALRYLVEREMVVVEGDVVSIHPRFAYLAGEPAGEPPSPV